MDNSVKDLGYEEDRGFIARVNEICLANPAQQNLTFTGGFSAITYAEALKSLSILPKPKPIGVVLMNDAMGKEFLKWPATSIGDAAATDQYLKGITTGTVFGYKVLFTIKNDLVPMNRIYIFSTEDFLGKMFLLQDATVYIKHEMDIVAFTCYESVGVGIGNTNSVVRATFVP